MKLQKSPDNTIYQAKLGNRRIRVAQIDKGVRVTIKRLLDDETLNRDPLVVKRNRGDVLVETVYAHQIVRHTTDKHSAEMSFRLSDEGAEALCVLLNNWFCKRNQRPAGSRTISLAERAS